VADWCIQFYDTYEKCPYKNIQSIFENKRASLKDEEAEIVSKMLSEVSEKYEIEQGINVPYLVDETEQYFKRRELEIRTENVRILLSEGKIKEAEDQFAQFRKVQKITSDWTNPFDDKEIDETFAEQDTVFFQLPGQLGEFLGIFEREWLIGVSAPFKKGKCLDEDSEVLLSDGNISTIKEIINSGATNSVSFDEKTQKFVETEIIEYINNGLKPVFKVTTRTGRNIKITKGHPLLTPYGWKPLSELSVGDVIALPKSIGFFGKNKLEDYKIKFLAYMLTEGGLTGQLSFTKKDPKTREDFISTINSFGDKARIKDDLIHIYIKRIKRNNGLPECRKWLDSIGVGKEKSRHKSIPKIIFTLEKKKLVLFLSILFSCDGSVWKNGTQVCVEYSSASKKFIYQVQNLLSRFGIISIIGSKVFKNWRYWSLGITGREPLLKFVDEIGFYIEKKDKLVNFLPIIKANPNNRSLVDLFYNYDELQEISYKYKPDRMGFNDAIKAARKKKGGVTRGRLKNRWETTNDPDLKTFYESEIFWDRIKKIERGGIKQTYDLSVNKHHNFVANNMLVHNSFLVQEFGIMGIFSGLRVAFFSLEMSKKQMKKRIYRRLTATGNQEDDFRYPMFDCWFNQTGECEMAERTNKITLLDENGRPPEYSPDMEYRPCTYCRDKRNDNYGWAVWYETIRRPKFNLENVAREIKPIQKRFGNMFRIKAYPKFTANVSDIMRDLDVLEHTEGFTPDMVIIDYADSVKPEDQIISGVDKEDRTWIALGQLAGIRKVLVFAPTQTTKDAMEARQTTSKHTARWVGKLGHVEVMLAMSQTKEEKEQGIMRISTMMHRHEDFNEDLSCIILQNIKVGQTLLDSQREGR